MRTLIILTFVSLLSLTVLGQQYSKPSNTKIGFKIKNAGFNVKGKFKTVTIKGVFDKKNTSKIKLKGTALAKTISTGISLRDKHLRNKKEFFNIATHKYVTMESYKVQKISDSKYTVFWKVTIRGVLKKIKTTMYVKNVSGGVELSTGFKVNRNIWGLGGKSITMGDVVTVKMSTTLK